MVKIVVIIPCFQNEGNIPITCTRLIQNENQFNSDIFFEYIMIDDGSKDTTFQELCRFKTQFPDKVTVVKLQSNVGPYNAIYAGLQLASGNCIVVMAADLQDPPELILPMYNEWAKGTKIVLASRSNAGKPIYSGLFANTFHWLVRKVVLPNLPKGGFDFCLFDTSAKQKLLAKMQPDINSLYLLLTLKEEIVTVSYEKQIRQIGTSKWTLRKKLKLTWNTLFYFLSVRYGLATYFWKKQTYRKEPFVIDTIL